MSRQSIPADCTPLQAAMHSTVHDYRDPRSGKKTGAMGLGPKLARAPRALSSEVNPDVSTHKMGLEDSVTVQLLANDFRILHAYAAELHHLAIPLPDYSFVSDVELLNAFTEWQAALGKTNQELNDALNPDGPGGRDITDAELRAVENRFYQHMQRGLQLLHRVREITDKR